MRPNKIQSKAFTLATLGSERIRIIGLIIMSFVFALILVVRGWVGSSDERYLVYSGELLLACFIGYEALMLCLVKRCTSKQCDIPSWSQHANVLIETSLPTIGIFIMTESTALGPYWSLSAPAIMMYFLFIILSALRLRPFLCLLTGLTATVGYLAITGYTYWTYPLADPEAQVFGLPVYLTYAAMFLIAGCVAAAVAGQIRKHVVVAIAEAETRQRLERDLEIARSIQQGLLPSSSPKIQGYEIAGWSKPAEQTGGDYYDWLELPNGRVGITLADVTGHGIGPALVTANCHAYVHSMLPGSDELGQVMQCMNELLVEDLPSNLFVTLVIASIDTTQDQLQLLSAGHGPLLVYKADEHQVLDFKAHGIPLGLAASTSYGPAQKIDLSPGDIIILLTDGFYEWTNAAAEQFGLDRLKSSILTYHDLAPDAFIQALYKDVISFAGDMPQQDDLTAVVLKRTP